MNETDIKTQAMLKHFAYVLSQSECVTADLIGELAVRDARIAELKAEVESFKLKEPE